MSMKPTSQHMLKALSLALNGPELFLSDTHNNMYNSHIRFVYYNENDFVCSSNDCGSHDSLLLQPHTDFLVLTMGFQDANGGLEVWDKKNKKWIDVPYVKDTMIVNIGDAMQRWSNDRFIANFHRVKSIKSNKERFSFYIFVGPENNQMIDCRDFGVSEDNMKYNATTFGEYFMERIQNTFNTEARNDQYTGDLDALSK
eukprot:431449_1